MVTPRGRVKESVRYHHFVVTYIRLLMNTISFAGFNSGTSI